MSGLAKPRPDLPELKKLLRHPDPMLALTAAEAIKAIEAGGK
jgi:hypothetical protein